MIFLDYQDRRPIYEQIVDKLRTLILNDALPPESKMPSVRQLAMDLSINPNTIQRAYMELEQEGLIYPVKGRGNFVSDIGQIRTQKQRAYYQELDTVISKGISLGITETQMYERIHNLYSENSSHSHTPNTEGDHYDSD